MENNATANEETVVAEELTVEEQLTVDFSSKRKDKFLRLFAEFENYKRRTTKSVLKLKQQTKSFISYASCT
jgi:molecular chaperone GrpE